ncbi:MAG: rod shape-determining protein MreC [Psychromonas sp.]
MKTIFTSGPSFLLRLALAIAFAAFLILGDSKFNLFSSARVYLNSLVSPVQYIADLPQKLIQSVSENVMTRQELKTRNQQLEKDNLHLKADRLLLTQLENENEQLRELLNSERTFTNKRMITEVMSLRSDPFTHQLLIDKGISDGVYVGQPVINDQGVVGQVSQVGTNTSRVLLIVDASHGIPVRVQRNDITATLHGSGAWDKLNVPFIQSNADLQAGDVLVTSGLGGRFPAGYPVATITYFSYEEGALYANVTATPVAELDRSRYLLLLWNDQQFDEAELYQDLLETTESIEASALETEQKSPTEAVSDSPQDSDKEGDTVEAEDEATD